MRISDQFPSNFLRAADFEGETTLIMADVKIEEVGADKDQKPILYFEGVEKGMVLNKTNSNTIATLYGEDTDDWKGEAITLFSAIVSYQGQNTPAIRMKAPSRKKGGGASNSPPSAGPGGSQKKIGPTRSIDTDEIPF